MAARSAFVAMQFGGDPWNDKRYVVITETLQEAGFEVTRGDEIRTASVVMEAVLTALKDADLVVIDSSGDSHNVSYEIGFCQGIGRDVSSLILLRAADQPIPFNYSHYRHLLYHDLRHLRHLLRHRLDVTVPLTDDQGAFCFAFDVTEGAEVYGDFVARVIVASLVELKFTGRCEYYAAERVEMNPLRYVVGLGLQATRPRRKLPFKWWTKFADLVEHKIFVGQESKIRLIREDSELFEIGDIRADQLLRGAVEFRDGRVIQRFGLESDRESWFGQVVADASRDSSQ